MSKIYAVFLLIVLLLSKQSGQAQTINLLSNSSQVCAGQPFSISFTTSGTFAAGNTFRVQVSNSYGNTYMDVPGSFTSSPASVTLPASGGNSYTYRVVADRPQTVSSPSTFFRVADKPSAQLTGSSAGSVLQNPYTPVNLNVTLSGGGNSLITLQNGLQFTVGSDFSSAQNLSVAPAQTTTYSLSSVQNSCGTGPVSGTTTVLVNAVGFRLVDPTNQNLCLGTQLPVYFSTTAPLPANTSFEAELIDTYNGNRSIALPVTGSTSPLLVTLPNQYPGNSTSGYKLRIYSKAANVSAWLRDDNTYGNTFALTAPPRLALTAEIASIPFGGQTSLSVFSQAASGQGEVVLSDGQQLSVYGGTSITTSVSPSATTSYSIVSYTGACSEATTYTSRTVTVRVRPGIRIDSLSATEICPGLPVTAYYTATPGYTLPSRLRVQYGQIYGVDAQVTRPGQLVFTPPASSTPVQSQSLLIRDAQADTLIARADMPLLVRGKPQAYLASQQQTITNPGLYWLGAYVTANSTSTVLFNTGDRLTTTNSSGQGYYSTVTLPVYVSKTTTYSIVSVSNECGSSAGLGGATTVVVQNPTPPAPGIILNKAEQSQYYYCPGSRQWLNVQPTGTFNADNQFQLEMTTVNGNFIGSFMQSFTDTPAVSFTLPTAPGTYRVRISSTSPFTQSSEQTYYIPNPPTASVGISSQGGLSSISSLTIVPGQTVMATYFFQDGRAPYQYELLNGRTGKSVGDLRLTDMPTVNTTYGIARVTDACGLTATIRGETRTVTVIPTIIRTGYIGTSQVCVQIPFQVPFTQISSVPASVSYIVQVADDKLSWQTVPTTGNTSPLTVTLPASLAGRSTYYRVAALSNGNLTGGVPFNDRLNIGAVPNVTLTTPSGATAVSLEQGSSVDLRLTDATSVTYSSAGSIIYLSNGEAINRVLLSNRESTVYINQPGTYSLVSSQNACGYGTNQGTVRVIAKPYVTRAATNGTAFCVGQRVVLTYALGGELNADNKVSVYLVNRFMGDRMLLTENASLTGVQSFTLGAGLSPGSYSFEFGLSSPQTTLLAGSLDVDAPVSVTLASGGQAFYQNDMGYLYLIPSTSRLYSLTLATPGGQSISVPDQNAYYIPVRITQSGSYSIAAVANRCGAGRASGVMSVTAIPAASVTIRPELTFSQFCTNKSYVASLNTTGTFDASNTFTAYLSDSTGASVRTLPSISRGSQLTITVPTDLPRGDNYVLRVGSSSPQHLGASASPGFKVRPSPTGTLTGNNSLIKGDSTRLNVALTGTAPWQLTITDFFGPRTFTATTSPFTLTVKPDTTSGYRLTEVRDSQCGVGTASGTALITVSRLLATEPALPLQVRAWPNPTTGWLQVEGELPGQSEVSFELLTTSGRLVQRSVGGVRQGRLEHRIDLSTQPGGVYILSAEQVGRRSQFKIIKQ